MSTTLTPLDEASRLVGERSAAMDEAFDAYNRAQTYRAQRIPGWTHRTVAAAETRYLIAVARYDAARKAQDEEAAKRPDLHRCTCGDTH
jgi:hypothetical protein